MQEEKKKRLFTPEYVAAEIINIPPVSEFFLISFPFYKVKSTVVLLLMTILIMDSFLDLFIYFLIKVYKRSEKLNQIQFTML